jgi:hypothetical protein
LVRRLIVFGLLCNLFSGTGSSNPGLFLIYFNPTQITNIALGHVYTFSPASPLLALKRARI